MFSIVARRLPDFECVSLSCSVCPPLLLNSGDIFRFLRDKILPKVPVLELVGPLLLAFRGVSHLIVAVRDVRLLTLQ